MSDNINKTALKAGVWYTISNFIIRGMSFLTTPIFTRLLSQEEYGQFSNFSSWMALLTIITTLELYVSVNRAKFDFEDDLDGYLSSVAVCGTLFTGICYLIVIVWRDFFVKVFNMDMLYIHIMFIYLLFQPALVLLSAKYRIMMKYKLVTFLTMLSTISSVLLSLVLVITLKNRFLARVLGNNIPLIVVNVILYILIIIKGKKLSFKYCKYALMISIPLLPHVLAGNVFGTTDRIMITQICGPVSNAIYSLVYSCSLLISILMNSVNQAWVPWFYEKLNGVQYDEIRKISKKYVTLFCFFSFVFMLLGPEAVLVLGGEKYKEAIYLMPPIMLGCVMQFLYTLYVNVEIFHKKTFGISIRTVIAALFNLGANAIAIPLWGYQAAAYTTLLGYFILYFLHYLAARKLGSGEYYDNKYIWCIAGGMFLLSGIVLYTYYHFMLRYLMITLCIVLTLCVLIRFRKDIKNMIEKGK